MVVGGTMDHRLVLPILGVLACGSDDPATTVDAVTADAATTDAAGTDAPIVDPCTQLAPGGTHKVFMVFDGLTLHPGTTDATTDTWSVVDQDRTLPAWLPGDASREVRIAAVVCAVRQVLDPFDVEVVTTRPATGPYTMIIVGGAPSDLGLSSTVGSLGASPDCQRALDNEIGWAAGSYNFPNHLVANYAIGVVGLGVGLDGTVDGTDCMCNWGVPCPGPPETMRCTLGTAARLGPSPTCGTPNGTQDEPAAFLAAFGERP